MRAARAAAPLADPALLIPIDVRVLPYADDSAARAWSWGRPDYDALRYQRRADPEPFNSAPVSLPGQRGFRGPIVHWALPDALTAGGQTSGAPVRYPAVPNRWLVARKYPAGGAWRHRAWVVAGDVSPSPGGRGSPWPTPAGGQTTIGAWWPVDQWPGEAALAAPPAPLTAVGPGDPAFAAFTPDVDSVFSFGDDLLTDPEPGGVRGPFQYTVLGWYANPEHDPLLGAADYGPAGWQTEHEWQTLMDRLGLTAGGPADLARAERAARDWAIAHGRMVDERARTRFPARTLCVGSVQGVPWNGPEGPTASGVPTSNPQLPSFVRPRLAVAHNAADALAAVYGQVRRDEGVDPDVVAQLTDVFTAFASDLLPLLDEADGLEQLAAALQHGWFSAADGGQTWEVVARADAGAPQGDAADPPLTAAQRELLDTLNTAQLRTDSIVRTVESEQWSLYALWWKGRRLAREIPPREKLKEQVAEARRRLEAVLLDRLAQLDAARGERDAAARALREALNPDIAGLVPVAAPPFRAPTDPVVLVSGVRRGHRHGADGRLREDGKLGCRFTGQSVCGIAVAVPGGYAAVTSQDIPPPHWRPADLPAEAPDLLAESFFLGVDDAPQIAAVAAAKAGITDPWTLLHTIRTEQTLVWNQALHALTDPAALEDESSFLFSYGLGALPQAIGVVFYSPPWSPLCMDWQFDYYPGAPTQRGALAPWELPPDGPRHHPLDAFTYRPRTDDPPPLAHGFPLSGRSLLTPQATDLLVARLEKLLRDFPDAPEVRDDIDALRNALAYARGADLLSQAAGGLNLALLERSPAAFVTPDDGSLDPYLHPPGGPSSVPDSTPEPPGRDAATRFHGLRAGHVRLTRLWIVDDFGQVYKVVDPSGGVLPYPVRPALPADLATPGDATLIAFKPRITQTARLTLDLPADPVHGWVMHNRLDHALLVYAADGAFQGAVLEGDNRALWAPAPELWRPADSHPDPSAVADPQLRALIEGLLRHRDGAAALRSLLALIDEATWSREPSAEWIEELPLLTGRPLAVARGRLSLAVRGEPAFDQAWEVSGLDVTDGFDAVPFPVQLGTGELHGDGLTGFYLDGDYSTINTVHPVPADGYVAHRRPEVTLDGTLAPFVTLLMDPTAAVHAISGVLPVTRVELPARLSVPALRRLAVTTRVGPVIGTPGDARMPLPKVSKGTWSWLEYQNPDETATASGAVVADTVPALSDAYPVIREGWLGLDPDGTDTTLTYAVTPAALAVTADPAAASAASLRFTVHNDTGAPVHCAEITIALPVGRGPGDLTAEPQSLDLRAEPPGDWLVRRDAPGRFTARPTAPPFRLDAGAGVVFEAAGIRVGGPPGPVAIELAARTSPAAPDSAARGVVSRATAVHRDLLRIEKAPTRSPTALTYTAEPGTLPTGRTARLRIVCFNGSGAAVECTRIVVTLPVGTGAADLTDRPDLVTAAVDNPVWRVAADGAGGFVLTPAGDATVFAAPLTPGAALTVDLDRIEVTAAPGLALLAIAETTQAADSDAPAAARTAAGVDKRDDKDS